MSTNRPFLANFLAAFRAQSTYKASTAGTQSATGPSSQIAQSARAIATKAGSSGASSPEPGSTTTHHYHHHHHHHPSASTSSSAHSRPNSHPRTPLNQASAAADSSAAPTSPPATPASSSTPIPIASGHNRQRRGSDSSNGSGGFRDALGQEKWYIGGRTPGGDERFYRLGMVTKGGGRLGGSTRVGSIDQLSL
ncbi:uncharacterized protein KD926_010769 [Aspergillus affinis]|uniref:uncharacterized protein n=1 Tax=Aspergillus affinis TaxID=1070780 RepID=UPI0022FEBB57|nr:uncharacterized protein KD926_010769 [Aspergillus affinis]KAI9038457.1 hypothetical protein KD926_010769 [Aspergillus affinis]